MALFRRRLEQLDKAVKNDWPAPVVCLGVKLCLQSCIALYGERGSDIVGEMLLEHCRSAAGLCQFCGERDPLPDYGMCERCWAEAAAEDLEEES